MTFADLALARRIEFAEAINARGFANRPGSVTLEIAGGWAVFAGVGSPISHAVGIGLDDPVREAQIDAIEAFYRSRDNPSVIELCPLADPGLLPLLGARGYRVTEFNNVLVKRLAGTEIVFTPRVRRAVDSEEALWSHTAGWGFFEHSQLTAAEMEIGRAIFAMEGALCYFAATETGELAGSAAAAMRSGLATLFADSTIAGFRRRSLHSELISARLNEAVAQGCDMATASTLPGSGSQRNYERLGFEVVYTRVTLTG